MTRYVFLVFVLVVCRWSLYSVSFGVAYLSPVRSASADDLGLCFSCRAAKATGAVDEGVGRAGDCLIFLYVYAFVAGVVTQQCKSCKTAVLAARLLINSFADALSRCRSCAVLLALGPRYSAVLGGPATSIYCMRSSLLFVRSACLPNNLRLLIVLALEHIFLCREYPFLAWRTSVFYCCCCCCLFD